MLPGQKVLPKGRKWAELLLNAVPKRCLSVSTQIFICFPWCSGGKSSSSTINDYKDSHGNTCTYWYTTGNNKASMRQVPEQAILYIIGIIYILTFANPGYCTKSSSAHAVLAREPSVPAPPHKHNYLDCPSCFDKNVITTPKLRLPVRGERWKIVFSIANTAFSRLVILM